MESDINNYKHRGGNSLYEGGNMKRDMTKVDLDSPSSGSPDYDPFINLKEEIPTPDDRSFK